MKNVKVITELDKLRDAIDSKEVDINTLTWRTKKGVEVRLMDMNKEALESAHKHAYEMLYNTNKYTPGKFQVKKNIKTLIDNCNAELLLRYIIYECNIDIFSTNIQVLNFVRERKAENNLSDSDYVSTLFMNLPTEFETVTIGQLIDASIDNSGIINRNMISDKFIIAQGIWLTEEEKEELTEYNGSGKIRPWLDVIKERLSLNNVQLRVNPRGFSYNEFRSLIHLEPLSKISKLPSNTLRLLRDKVFVLLFADIDYHIEKWTTIMDGIEKVIEYKGY